MTQKFGTAVAIAASGAIFYVGGDVVGHSRRAAQRRLSTAPNAAYRTFPLCAGPPCGPVGVDGIRLAA